MKIKLFNIGLINMRNNNLNRFSSFFIAVLLALAFSSCGPKYYIPNSQNVPLLSQKGETNINVSLNDDHVNLNGAYAFSDHFGIIGNAGLLIPSDNENGDGGSGNFVTLGGGYFSKLNDSFVIESYAIFGYGTIENHFPSTTEAYPQTTGNISANLFRFGMQPSFGYKSDYFSFAISARFMSINYSHISGDLIYGREVQTDYLKDNSSSVLIEPAITRRGGVKRFKLQLQYGYSYNVTNRNFRQDISFLTLGANFKFY